MAYKLVYFPARGRVEGIRLLLKDNNIPFTDEVIHKEDWPANKERFYFGHLPCFWDGDFEIVDSSSIIRHLARKHGLYGSSEQDMTRADMIFDSFVDLEDSAIKILWGEYEKEKAGFFTSLPTELTKFEKVFTKFSPNGNYFTGHQITFADYKAFSVLDRLRAMHSPCLDDFPRLREFHFTVSNRPEIKRYYAEPANLNRPFSSSGHL